MDSQHLVHAYNMYVRARGEDKAKQTLLWRELWARKLTEDKKNDAGELYAPTWRENHEQLCMQSVLIDHAPQFLQEFRLTPKPFMTRCPKEYPELWAKYCFLRLTK